MSLSLPSRDEIQVLSLELVEEARDFVRIILKITIHRHDDLTRGRVEARAQRRRFADTFRWGLVRTYALALIEFNDEGEVVLVPPDRPPRSPKRQTVKMEIRSASGEVYPLLYSMGLGKDGVWRVRNIIVNGINMGLTYRSQFASAMNDRQYGGDMDLVIDAWGEMLAAERAAAEEAAAEEEAAAPAEESAPVGEGDQAGIHSGGAQGAIVPLWSGAGV